MCHQAAKLMNDIEGLAKACLQKYGDSGSGGTPDAGPSNGGSSRRSSLYSAASGGLVTATSSSITSRRSGHGPAPLQVSAVRRLRFWLRDPVPARTARLNVKS